MNAAGQLCRAPNRRTQVTLCRASSPSRQERKECTTIVNGVNQVGVRSTFTVWVPAAYEEE